MAQQQQQQSRQRRQRDNDDDRGNGRQREQRSKPNEYEEDDGWASAFHRPENEGNQPRYTGQGIDQNGNPIEIAVWIKRAKTGTKYLRIHLQPPYEADDNADDVDDPEPDDGDDLPF